jgi:hypothetical protein
MTTSCSSIVPDVAPGLVMDAWSTFRGFAYQGLALVTAQIDSLNNFTIPFQQWDASWQADGTLSGFTRPQRPTLPPITAQDLSATIPGAPSVAIPPVALTAAPSEPTFVRNPPNLNLTVNAPDDLDAERPDSAPELNIPDLPDLPALTMPDAPDLEDIGPYLPEPITITVTEFVEPAPEFDAPPPSESLDFTEAEYVSALLEKVKARVSAMLDGGTGLPAAIEAALFSRAADRDDASAAKLAQEVREEFASRGFDAEPNGILARRALEVRQTNRNARAGTNREIRLQNAELEQRNLQFAVTSGISLEVSLLQAHLAVEQRKFEYASKLKDISIAVFQAHVTRFNALVAAYNARIEAYKAFLDGQRARVDIYRAEIEAAKARGEINEQRVRAYEAQIRAEQAKADAARALIEGFRARIEGERAKIEAYRGEVDAYRSYVDAYRAEWETERTRLEAEASRGRLYESAVNAYATRINAWAKTGDARIEEHRANLTSAQALLQQHEAAVRTVLAKLQAIETYTRAQASQGDQLSRMYEAEARVEAAAVDADNRAYQTQTDRERNRLEVKLADVRIQIEQVTTIANLMLRAMESAAQAGSQLTASAYSAVSFSAGASSSQSRSQGCDTNYNFSGEIATDG